MGKNIVICSDGTGNTTIKDRGTNVFKLFEAVKTNHSSTPQVAIYDDGVGSGTSKFSQILGGAFGFGLSRNVRQLYTSLVRNYDAEAKDKIFLFGFSRGAFTVRSLAGMIGYMGILDRNLCKTDSELNEYVSHAYREYRRSQRAWLETLLSWIIVDPFLYLQNKINKKEYLVNVKTFNKKFLNKPEASKNEPDKLIRFIGVWDTVSAVGFPVPWVSGFFNKAIYRFSFTDNDLNQDVQQACHALSIDDQRKTFHPEVWNEFREEDKKRIEQVWFAGVHSNVGGGYPKQGMSLVSLNWMMRKARDAGVEFIDYDLQLYTARQNVNDKLYDSRHGLSVFYRFKPRDIYAMCQKHGVTARIHSSVLNRIQQGTGGYAPGNIPREFEVDDTEQILCNWPTCKEEILNALGDDTSLLNRTRDSYTIRKFAHGIFSSASVYLIYDFYSNTSTFSDMAFADILKALLIHLFTKGDCLFGISCMLIIVIVFYFLLVYTKEKMHTTYSAFWYSLIRKHKNRDD